MSGAGLYWVIAIGVAIAFTVGLAGFMVLMLNVMQRTALRDATEAVDALRARTLKIFDVVETTKSRYLKLAGPGVPTPEGETQQAAAEAKKRIDELLDAWTSLQARVEKCKDLIAEEGKWGRKLLDEARDLALEKEVEATAKRAEVAGAEAQKVLDRLEEAPGRAVAAMGLLPPSSATEIEARLKSDPLGAANAAERIAKKG